MTTDDMTRMRQMLDANQVPSAGADAIYQRLHAERQQLQQEQIRQLGAGDMLPMEQTLRLHALSEICGEYVLRMNPAPSVEQMQQMAADARRDAANADDSEWGLFGDRRPRLAADGCSLLTLRFPPGSKILEWMLEQINPHADAAEFALLCIASARRVRLEDQAQTRKEPLA